MLAAGLVSAYQRAEDSLRVTAERRAPRRLQTGRVAAAWADVFRREERRTDHPALRRGESVQDSGRLGVQQHPRRAGGDTRRARESAAAGGRPGMRPRRSSAHLPSLTDTAS